MFVRVGLIAIRALSRVRGEGTNSLKKSSTDRRVCFLCMLKRSSPRRFSKLYLVLECAALLLNSLAGESETFVPSAKDTERDMSMVVGRRKRTDKRLNDRGSLCNHRAQVTRLSQRKTDLLLCPVNRNGQARSSGGKEGGGYRKRSNIGSSLSRARFANTFPPYHILSAQPPTSIDVL